MSDLDLLKLAAGEPTGSSDRLDPPSLERVTAVFPQLEILELLGVGGMGAVYKARQKKLDRLVALKILADKHERQDFRERFEREGRLLARLNHPNIVAVYDFGESDGFFYLLMEYVEGVNLRQAMRSERFTPEQALAIIPEICDALSYAHDEGILHRDIKPENILLDTKGRIKIADFGIGKLKRAGDEAQRNPRVESGSLTQEKEMLGTPFYAAPEQLESAGTVDHRADIYSLGVVFYELLTGELPIGRFAPPSEKSNVNRNIDPIVLKSLEKEREKRQQSAEQFKAEVENATKHGVKFVNNERKPSKAFAVWGLVLFVVGLLTLGAFLGVQIGIVKPNVRSHWDKQANLERQMMSNLDKEMQQWNIRQVEKYRDAQNLEKDTKTETIQKIKEEEKKQSELFRIQVSNIMKRGAPEQIALKGQFEKDLKPWRFLVQALLGSGCLLTIIGVFFSWIHLFRIRRSREKPFFRLGLATAIPLPMLALWGGSLVLFVLPYPGGVTWTLGNLVGLGVSIYLVRTTYLWAKG